jgi:hypothetical protein
VCLRDLNTIKDLQLVAHLGEARVYRQREDGLRLRQHRDWDLLLASRHRYKLEVARDAATILHPHVSVGTATTNAAAAAATIPVKQIPSLGAANTPDVSSVGRKKQAKRENQARKEIHGDELVSDFDDALVRRW